MPIALTKIDVSSKIFENKLGKIQISEYLNGLKQNIDPTYEEDFDYSQCAIISYAGLRAK